jgi:hypothetical protein
MLIYILILPTVVMFINSLDLLPGFIIFYTSIRWSPELEAQSAYVVLAYEIYFLYNRKMYAQYRLLVSYSLYHNCLDVDSSVRVWDRGQKDNNDMMMAFWLRTKMKPISKPTVWVRVGNMWLLFAVRT